MAILHWRQGLLCDKNISANETFFYLQKYGDDDAMAMNNVSPHNSRDLPQLFSFREAEEAPEITQELSIFQV